MCKVDSVLNHVSKAAKCAESDSDRNLYSKTVDKYETQVVEAVERLAEALSCIVGRQVTITVQSECNSKLQDGSTSSESSRRKSSSRSYKDSERIKELESKVKSLESTLETVVSQNNTTIQMMASLSKYVTGEERSFSQKASERMESDSSKRRVPSKGALTSSKERSCPQPKPLQRQDTANAASSKRCAEQSNSASVDKFANSKVRKVFHRYSDDDAEKFYRILKDLPHSAKCASAGLIAEAVAPWFDCRFISKKPPKNKRGRQAYHLYQFPRYLAYYVGVCAKNWGKNKFYKVRNDFLDYSRSVLSSKEEDPMPAPSWLIARSSDHVKLCPEEVEYGYWLWLIFVEQFNRASSSLRLGITLEDEFYTAKMKALGFGSEELLCRLQDTHSPYDIDALDIARTLGKRG